MKKEKKDHNKEERQAKILEIIASRDIDTQRQLIDALAEYGFDNTQATVSRDMRELRLVKEAADGKHYRYTAPAASVNADYNDKLKTIFKESVTSFACAQNIVVIKTLPGLAPAACSALDGMRIKSLVGTLAGDDTAFLAMSDNESAEALCNEINQML